MYAGRGVHRCSVFACSSLFAKGFFPASIDFRRLHRHFVFVGLHRPSPGMSPTCMSQLLCLHIAVSSATTLSTLFGILHQPPSTWVIAKGKDTVDIPWTPVHFSNRPTEPTVEHARYFVVDITKALSIRR
jgi:hypothetical protein